MSNYAILVGNDINNIVPQYSWKDLLHEMIQFCNVKKLVKDTEFKPFPLLYEEIFLRSLKDNHPNERELKEFISNKVSGIQTSVIHERIKKLPAKNILTTNYDFSLEGSQPEKSNSIIEEKVYSVFRKYEVDQKNYWHIHGDCRIPNSINLGFEHYGGQLQQIRNYTATGTNYQSRKVAKLPLIRRLATGQLNDHCWIDLFFTKDIYIFGLSLDFVETDLWWLLTFRARQLYYRKKVSIKNNIYYFLPKEYKKLAKPKTDLLRANGVIVVDTLAGTNKLKYYNAVLSQIEKVKR